MKFLATLHRTDETKGAVRVEDLYDTDIEDLWDACTGSVEFHGRPLPRRPGRLSHRR